MTWGRAGSSGSGVGTGAVRVGGMVVKQDVEIYSGGGWGWGEHGEYIRCREVLLCTWRGSDI